MKLYTRFAGLLCLTIGIAGAPAAATVIAGSSSAYGEAVSLSGVINASSPQQPATSGSAPAPYNVNNNLASVSVPGALSTGIMNVSASSDVDGLAGLRMATASASVNTLSVGLAGILSLSATSVGSTATETGEPLSSLGSTSIVNGVLTIGLTIIPIPANPAPNTSLFNAGGISVIVNEQILGVGSIQVNAIHISLNVLGTSGNIYISHSQAALTSNIPEPSTALLLGVGLALFSVRRR
jgi:PEP-CTERM motif-containing protein